MVAQDGYGRPRGINAEGLKRRGFDAERIAAIKRAYRAAVHVRRAAGRSAQAELAETRRGDSADVRAVLDFIERSERAALLR